MIVVVGQPVLRVVGDRSTATGGAARIAMAAVSAGSTVQLVGKVGEDPEGEALVLALAQAAVGHVAVLRDPARRTPRLLEPARDVSIDAAFAAESDAVGIDPADPALRPELDPADVDLGLRYVTEFSVLVVTEHLDRELSAVVIAAAGWASATLIVLVEEGGSTPPDLPPDALVLQAPPIDPDGPFDILVGQLAAAIDRGTPPRDAFRELVTAAGWEPAEA